jgi:hypothetical protein
MPTAPKKIIRTSFKDLGNLKKTILQEKSITP